MKGLNTPPGRRRLAVIGAVIVLLAAAVPVALSVIPSSADAAVSTNAGGNALGNLANRSPGERLVGVAMKAARAVRDTLGVGPSEPEKRAERALARPPAGPTSESDVAFALQEPPVPAMPGAAPELAGLPGDLPGGIVYNPGSSGGLVYMPISGGGSSGGSSSGGSSGGTGSSGGGSSGGGDTPPVSAVPEPATWAMMILGFGLLGGSMRRQSRKVRLARA